METFYPGQVIGVRVGAVIHIGIVTVQYDDYGAPMVISNSQRAGGVAEEPLSVFQGPYELISVEQPASLPVWYVLARARQCLGTRWNLSSWNCEHFVNWVYGREPESPQLQRAVAILGIGLLLASLSRA